MASRYDALVFAVSRMHRETWLLYLNYLLSIRRDTSFDPALVGERDAVFVPPHVVRFLAKLFICYGKDTDGYLPTWDWYRELRDIVIELDDPIVDDPTWKHADPTGFLVRIHNQQMPSQDTRRIQRLGLAARLFYDLPPLKDGYSLRDASEAVLGMSIHDFMSIGLITSSLQAARCGGHPCCGTFTRGHYGKAFDHGASPCKPELWEPFLNRTSVTPDQFREECLRNTSDFTRKNPQYAFNPLLRFPIIRTGVDSFVAPDPSLVVDRTCLGIFYDLFEEGGTRFTDRFGFCFERLIEGLIRSNTPEAAVWTSEWWDSSERKKQPPSKFVDIAICDAELSVLVECKSHRSSFALATQADDSSVQDMVKRIASALAKCMEHAESIAKGEWREEGLLSQNCVCVIVTYGKLYTANSPFVRSAVLRDTRFAGKKPPPWVVLSVEDFDAAASLVDAGKTWREVASTLCSDETAFDPLSRHFKRELRKTALANSA